MKRILQIDGGGLKGIIPAVILDYFEHTLDASCHEIFNLIAGTSTGAIIGGVLAEGSVPARMIRQMYVQKGKKLFTPHTPAVPLLGTLFGGSKYDRRPFIDELRKIIGDKKLYEVKTRFMATAMNLCSKRTHYIYSDDPEDAHYSIGEVISWSALSAAAYFGKICVPDFLWDDYLPDGTVVENIRGAVFQDGGQGINNCTLGASTVEAIARKWYDEHVVILSLGCGDHHERVPYEKASRTGLFGQVRDFLFQAREEAPVVQYMASRYLSISCSDRYTLVRINCSLPKKTDVLDGTDWISDYEQIGEQLKDSVPFDLFK